jgi:hypothetical protein
MSNRTAKITIGTLLVFVTSTPLLVRLPVWATGDGLEFDDLPKQTQEFIRYNRTISLIPEQEAVRKEALTPLPAPCCSDETAYTCCCPCNMALAIWGLSKYLITEHDYDAEQVRDKVSEWIRVINPGGYTGDACYSRGCGRPFRHNGCGGMREGQVPWGD